MGNSDESHPLVEKIEEYDFRLRVFHMLGKVLDHTLDLDALLASAVDMFLEVTRADAGFIMVTDEKADALVFGAAKGLKKGIVEKIEVNIEKDIAREITRMESPILLASVKEPRLGSFFQELFEPLEEVEIGKCFPLVSSGKLVGLINVSESSSGAIFTKTDPHMLFNIISSRVAAAVETAQLHRHVVEQLKELRWTNEALRKSEERFRDIVNAASDWFWEMDENLRFTYGSDRFYEITGLKPEDIIGKQRTVLKSAVDEEEKWTRHWADLENRRPFRDFQYELTGRRSTFYISISGQPMFDGDGAFKGYRGAGQDITKHKESQIQLIQAAKLATLGEMATAMAHELNQPLNVIRMAAYNTRERIAAGKADRKYLDDKLERISGETERASEIIDHMRIFGRKADDKPKNLDLREMVNNALGLMGEQLRLRTIEVETRFPERCREISGHPVLIEQVVLNLLSNARDEIDANRTSPGDPRKIILTVEDMGSEGEVRIVVEDTGGGIPEDVIPRIFEPFFTTKEPGKGTGLGLSISYGIMRDLGGRIEAANVDQGAQFTITLPAVEENKQGA